MKKFMRWFWNIVQALDRLLNAVLGGTDKEYLSSRIYRFKDKSRFIYFCYKTLNRIQANHCEIAYLDAQVGFNPNDAVIK